MKLMRLLTCEEESWLPITNKMYHYAVLGKLACENRQKRGRFLFA